MKLETRLSERAYEDLPPPSAELAVLAAWSHAMLKRMPKKERREFLDDVESIMEHHAKMANVTRIRPPSQDAAKAEASRSGLSWVRMVRRVFEAWEP